MHLGVTAEIAENAKADTKGNIPAFIMGLESVEGYDEIEGPFWTVITLSEWAEIPVTIAPHELPDVLYMVVTSNRGGVSWEFVETEKDAYNRFHRNTMVVGYIPVAINKAVMFQYDGESHA